MLDLTLKYHKFHVSDHIKLSRLLDEIFRDRNKLSVKQLQEWIELSYISRKPIKSSSRQYGVTLKRLATESLVREKRYNIYFEAMQPMDLSEIQYYLCDNWIKVTMKTN